MSSYCNKKRIVSGKLPLQARSQIIMYDNNEKMCNKRIFRTYFSKHNEGSATVEATFVIPIFIFSMMIISMLSRMMCTKAVVYEALVEASVHLAEYEYLYDMADRHTDIELNEGVSGTIVNAAALKRKLTDYIDDKELVEQNITGGINGIVVVKANYNSSDNHIYIEIVYQLRLNTFLFGDFNWNIRERIRQRAYLGCEASNSDDECEEEYVYIAENESVYHTSRNCYHIELTIVPVSRYVLEEKYSWLRPCDICSKNNSSSLLYITKDGEAYHCSKTCRGLKRTIYRVNRKDCLNLEKCKDCR